MKEALQANGIYTFRCFGPEGDLLWRREIRNVVATVGKNLAFNSFLNGSNYTVTGPYMGLIAAQGFTGVAASDTMTSHPGWLEAGSIVLPTYNGTRATCIWGPAANGIISLATPASYVISGSGLLQGAFIVFGSGAVNIIGSTGGTLWSAGSFASGQAFVSVGSTVQVNYSVSM